MTIEFANKGSQYRHWQLSVSGSVARLAMDVSENDGLFPGYPLKLNSYDLSVDIELFDIVTRLRFEAPQVSVVLLESAKDNVFCAGANIRMLAGASHVHKVNFCKFTNETRCAIETAGRESGQYYVSVIQGPCAGGGYELALATDYILLADDASSSVALPEVPLLAVLPGTGGLTRLTDKRCVRRDIADVFCTLEEGAKGQRALAWKLVDEIARPSSMPALITSVTERFSKVSKKNGEEQGIQLEVLDAQVSGDGNCWSYTTLQVEFDRDRHIAMLTVSGPDSPPPETIEQARELGSNLWSLAFARELDDALLRLRFNETDTGVLVFKSVGDAALVGQYAKILLDNSQHWFANEVLCYWTRLFKRLDMTSRSMVTLVEPGSCFAGPLLELLLACDRSYMLIGQFDDETADSVAAKDAADATLTLLANNFGTHPMANGLTRLETRFLNDAESLAQLQALQQQPLCANDAIENGLVTFAFDDIDWDDEIRLFLEERASFSPDALTAMEANLRTVGPETMETRIFGRLTAWQNWVFQRPNAVGEKGALQRYGTGVRGDFDQHRV